MEQETLEYRLAKLEQQNEKILQSVDELKDSMPKLYISKEIYRSEMSDLEWRIAVLENQSNKATWALLGAAGSLVVTLAKAFLGI